MTSNHHRRLGTIERRMAPPDPLTVYVVRTIFSVGADGPVSGATLLSVTENGVQREPTPAELLTYGARPA